MKYSIVANTTFSQIKLAVFSPALLLFVISLHEIPIHSGNIYRKLLFCMPFKLW